MPSTQLLYYLLFAVALFGGGGAIIHNLTPSPRDQDQAQKQAPVAPSVKPADKPARAAVPEKGKAPPTSLPAIAAPSFDVVRIEADGAGVIAGRAEPGWTVSIESRGGEIGRAVADRNGEWAVVLDKPLLPGEHSIGLRSMSPLKTQGLVSEQQVAISVAKSKAREETVVALTEPGKPTRMLTPKKSSAPPAQADEPAKQPDTAATSDTPAAAPGEPAASSDTRQANVAPSARPEKVVAFDAVDYEVNAKGVGKLFLSGQAEPGMRIRLYLDNNRVGDAVASADGLWTFESLRTLPPEELHTMRADAVQSDGQVASRAEVPFMPPVQPSAPVVAETKPAPPAAAMERKEQEPAKVAAATPSPVPAKDKAEQRQLAAAPTQNTAQSKPATQEPRVAAAPVPAQGKPEERKVAAAPAETQSEPARQKPPKTATLVPSPAPTQEKAKERQVAAASAVAQPKPAMREFKTPSAPAQPPADEAGQAGVPPKAAAVADPLLQKQEPQKSAAEPVAAPAQVATAAPVETGQQSAEKRRPLPNQVRSIVVRRGDTLWHIAERRYGHGWRYSVIYKSNRRQIRNPHWIYPGQEFKLPNR